MVCGGTATPSVKLHRKTQQWCALKLSDFSVGHGRPNPKDANSDSAGHGVAKTCQGAITRGFPFGLGKILPFSAGSIPALASAFTTAVMVLPKEGSE